MSSFGPPLSIQELALRMREHGIVCNTAEDIRLLETRLTAVGYYRLEEYTWSFRKLDPNDKSRRLSRFKRPMTFGPIWGAYLFDRRLRILLIDAIERFEIAMRNMVAQVFVEAAGDAYPLKHPHFIPGFMAHDPNYGTRGDKWKRKVNESFLSSNTLRIRHCRETHGVADVADLPIWITVELLTFGELKTLFDSMEPALKTMLAKRLGVADAFLSSTFALIHQVRNKCAHHARIWNIAWKKTDPRNSAKEVPIFRYHLTDAVWFASYNARAASWVIPSRATKQNSFSQISTAFVIVLCGFWLDKIAQTSHWKGRVEATVCPEGKCLSLATEAGFPLGWERHPLWKRP